MIDAALKIYNETGSAYKVSSKLGLTRFSAYKLLHDAGANIPAWADDKPLRWKIKGESEKELISDYLNGVSLKQLISKYKCGEVALRNTIKRNGITLRDHGGQRRRVTDDEAKEILNLYKKGFPQSAIANQMKCGGSTVSRILTSYGLFVKGRAFGENHGSWNGGVSKLKEGYVLQKIYHTDPYISMARRSGYVPQHRYVMAKHLGRVLSKDESVHHIDGDRANNNISNLQLRKGKHGKGVQYVCSHCGSVNIISKEI